MNVVDQEVATENAIDRVMSLSLSLSLSLSHNHAQYCIVLSLHVINTFIHHITHYY